MKPRKHDPLPKIRIQFGLADLKNISGGSARPVGKPPQGQTGPAATPDPKPSLPQ